MGEDGFYLPAPAEEYYRATRRLRAVAPVLSTVTEAIEEGKKRAGGKVSDE
ncbi:MAG: hypothetical protein JXR77_11980 [Lentisphaeria bacterium]|nr:hypothetical protein [Lentisphaeria bacterium]